jgi:hypothetical protein
MAAGPDVVARVYSDHLNLRKSAPWTSQSEDRQISGAESLLLLADEVIESNHAALMTASGELKWLNTSRSLARR